LTFLNVSRAQMRDSQCTEHRQAAQAAAELLPSQQLLAY
jgi:hypothetical protein